jgi:carbon-monoxide dehydrogenase small subunit
MEREIHVTVNGTAYTHSVSPRMLLVYYLRDMLGLTGAHVGCETSQCGACTVLVNNQAVKACTMLAIQADGASVRTVEGLAEKGALSPLQRAFWEEHALQCGFCTPGMLMSATALLECTPHPSEEEIRTALHGNICRCTGYTNIVRAVTAAAEHAAQG